MEFVERQMANTSRIERSETARLERCLSPTQSLQTAATRTRHVILVNQPRRLRHEAESQLGARRHADHPQYVGCNCRDQHWKRHWFRITEQTN
jgi:hypothetical protein